MIMNILSFLLGFRIRKSNKKNNPCIKSGIKLDTEFSSITVKAIIRWEQLRKKSFSQIDYSDKEDIASLLYTMYLDASGKLYEYDVFKQVLDDKEVLKAMSSTLKKIMSIMIQFKKNEKLKEGGIQEKKPETIGSIVAMLVMSGLDANYALNDMELCDLPMYIDAYERKKREEMESCRLWTYLSMLPHIDSKCMNNGVRDLITFPWEKVSDEEKEIKNEEIEQFEEFMKKGEEYGRKIKLQYRN